MSVQRHFITSYDTVHISERSDQSQDAYPQSFPCSATELTPALSSVDRGVIVCPLGGGVLVAMARSLWVWGRSTSNTAGDAPLYLNLLEIGSLRRIGRSRHPSSMPTRCIATRLRLYFLIVLGPYGTTPGMLHAPLCHGLSFSLFLFTRSSLYLALMF